MSSPPPQSAETALDSELARALTFDAGGPVPVWIPTVMLGPSSSDVSGPDVSSNDYVAESRVQEAAAVDAAFVSGCVPGRT